ncbi:hypothetical protein WG66_004868 [Moniliophthora roreri]|nr:hypothetical protein WG66_004868 [Moniliophthora roreri]
MTLFHSLCNLQHILKKEAERDSLNPESVAKALTEHVHETQYRGIAHVTEVEEQPNTSIMFYERRPTPKESFNV